MMEVHEKDKTLAEVSVRNVGRLGTVAWVVVATLIVLPVAVVIGAIIGPAWWVCERAWPMIAYVWACKVSPAAED